MKVTGQDLVRVLCNRLEDTGTLCHDTIILRLIKELTAEQLWQIISFGDVQKWHNERVNKQQPQRLKFETVEDENGFI